MTRNCGICGSRPGDEVSIGDEDGAAVAFVCERCVGRLNAGPECAICRRGASGKYQIILHPDDWRDEPRPVCRECRKRWVFYNTEPLALRLERLGVSHFRGETE